MSEEAINYLYYGLVAFLSLFFLLTAILVYLFIPTDDRRPLLPALSILLGGWLVFVGIAWFMRESQQANRAINESLDRTEKSSGR